MHRTTVLNPLILTWKKGKVRLEIAGNIAVVNGPRKIDGKILIFESFAHPCEAKLSIHLRLIPSQFKMKNAELNPPVVFILHLHVNYSNFCASYCCYLHAKFKLFNTIKETYSQIYRFDLVDIRTTKEEQRWCS